MLRFFSKFQRSRNAVLLFFCFVMILGLIVFYAFPSFDLNRGRGNALNSGSDVVIAKVGSHEIGLKDFRNMIQAIGYTYTRNNTLTGQMVRGLGIDKQALDRLIGDRLVLSEADRLGVAATDREVGDEIMKLPTFVNPETGKFIGKEEYLRQLALRGENVEEYERKVRSEIAVSKVRIYLISAEQISDRDLEEAFRQDNTKIELVYATIDNEKVRKRLQLSDADLRAYYDAHKDDFKANEPVRKVDYLFISTDKVAATMKITDEQLRAENEKNKQYEPRASIIKLNVLAPQDEPSVRAKIDDLNRRIRGTQQTPGEKFEDVARGNSQDPSASKGGDIGFIKKDPNHPSAWQQRAFNLKVGDLDGPFRDGQSYYLLKVTEQREVPFEQMRPTLKASLQNREAYAKASQLADQAYEKFTETKNLRQAAEAMAKEMKVSPDSLIRSTPFFKNGDTLPDIGSNPAFEEAAGQLKKGEIGDKVGIPGGLAVPQVADLREGGQQLTFEEAHNMVEQKVRREREQNLAQTRAQEIVNQAKNAAEFESLVKQEGLEVKTDTNFNNYTFPSLQTTQRARVAALHLKEGEVAKQPVKVSASYLMFAAKKRTEADLSQLAASREELRRRLIDERQNVLYEAYIKAARKRYEDAGKIKIYQDRIDAFLNSGGQPQTAQR